MTTPSISGHTPSAMTADDAERTLQPGPDRRMTPSPVRQALKTFVAVLALIEAEDQLVTVCRRTARRMSAWWIDVEYRQKSETRRSLLRYLGRLADPPNARRSHR